MKYILFNPFGKAEHFIDTPEELKESFIPGLILKEADEYTDKDLLHLILDVNTGVISKINREPLATSVQITNKRIELENAPISIDGFIFDCDVTSRSRMKASIDSWNVLPIIPGQFEIRENELMIAWTLADNTKIWLKQNELVDTYTKLTNAVAVRNAVLFNSYQRIKAIPRVTLSYVQNTLNWLE